MGAEFAKVVNVTEERPGKDAAYLLASAKARRPLGWHDAVALETGIAETIRWIDTHLLELQRQPPDYIHKP